MVCDERGGKYETKVKKKDPDGTKARRTQICPCTTADIFIAGVDPELYELTTSKLDTNTSSGSRVADAFARLMSTMEKTSTSTRSEIIRHTLAYTHAAVLMIVLFFCVSVVDRKPRKEENLSEEAEKVISALPDLSFMQAKVLMFPSTLTPLNCRD